MPKCIPRATIIASMREINKGKELDKEAHSLRVRVWDFTAKDIKGMLNNGYQSIGI